MSIESDIRTIVHEMRYQSSTGIHTYGPASCGHGNARGSGVCFECHRAFLAKLIGEPQAKRIAMALREIQAGYREIENVIEDEYQKEKSL